jgi:hypothetical protein
MYSTVDEISGTIPGKIAIEEVSPNPVKEDMTVRISITEKGKYYLEFVAPNGKVTATLYAGQLAPGKFSVNFRPGSLASGMYVCRLRGEGSTDFRKVVVL